MAAYDADKHANIHSQGLATWCYWKRLLEYHIEYIIGGSDVDNYTEDSCETGGCDESSDCRESVHCGESGNCWDFDDCEELGGGVGKAGGGREPGSRSTLK